MRYRVRLLLILVTTVLTASYAGAQFGYRYTRPELRDEIRNSKLDQLLIPIMEEWGVEAWVTLTRDPCDDMTNVIWERDIQLDPISEYIGAEQVTVPAVFIFTTSGRRIAIAEEGDASYIRDTGIYREVLTYTYNRAQGHSGFPELLGRTMRELDPRTIGLNFSKEEGVADGLTVGMKMIFDAAVGRDLASRVVSAERVVISLWNRKVADEVELITRSAVQSARLTDEALRAIRPGVTTARGLFDDIRRRMAELGLEPGWEEYWSPTITVSEFRLGKPPADRVIEPGDLVVVNSGFLVEGHMSDVNRMAYVLREDELLAPPLIQKLFDTGLASTRAGVAAIRPGATGEQVDAAARSVVVDAGFDEYGHATGHTTGVWVHGLGVIIGPRWQAYGEKVAMPMHQGDVYAIEPSLHAYSKAHGGPIRIHFQEMVIVTEDGARYLTEPVTELMLIR